jgi:hypothetical protein
MQIDDKCSNCKKPTLINRPWRNDIFCGWCSSEYRRDSEGKIYLVVGNNNHLTARLKEKQRLDNGD